MRDVIDTPEFKGGSISVFSLGRSGSEWCGCLFCHNLTPAPADDTAISESPVEEDVAWNVTILPISLIPEEGSDNHVVPLPVFTAPVEDVTVQQNKVRLFVLFVNFTWWLIDYELLDPVNEEIRSGPSHLLLLLAQEVIDQSLTSLTILPSVNTQVYELWSFLINEGNQSICSYVDLVSFFLVFYWELKKIIFIVAISVFYEKRVIPLSLSDFRYRNLLIRLYDFLYRWGV